MNLRLIVMPASLQDREQQLEGRETCLCRDWAHPGHTTQHDNCLPDPGRGSMILNPLQFLHGNHERLSHTQPSVIRFLLRHILFELPQLAEDAVVLNKGI